MMNRGERVIEHVLPRGVYARDYPGAGPALVLLHGFPDHLGIYDDVVPLLVAHGRRVVTFDYLGFGRSRKTADTVYSFEQQGADLEAVVEALGLGKVVLVPHDSSGLVAIDFALAHPEQVAALHILNSALAEPDDAVWPEMIALFADPAFRELALAIARDRAQLGWLLTFQQHRFSSQLSEKHRGHFDAFIGPLIGENLMKEPSSLGALVQMTGQFRATLARNRMRLGEIATLDIPVKVIWGMNDPYLTEAMGAERAKQFRNATFHPIDAGHWLQADEPALVAAALL